MDKIKKAYFRWLYERVKGDSRSYLLLCAYLDTVPFFWNVPNDGNREQDAIRQREIFISEDGFDFHSDELDIFYDSQVSVFEVLVALCSRLDYNVEKGESGWFYELLQNLGISWAVDDEFKYRLGARGEVDSAISTMMRRRYDFNGHGSLFPLRHRPKKSMTKVELWYQMMAYLEENY